MPPSLYSSDLYSLHASPISEAEKPRKVKKERTPAQAEALAAARQKRIDKRKGAAATTQPTPPPTESGQECEAAPTPEPATDVETKPRLVAAAQDSSQEELKKLREELALERRVAAELLKRKSKRVRYSDSEDDEPPRRPKKKTVRKATTKAVYSDDRPPAWFENYLVGIKTEQAKMANARVPKRTIREEAAEEADTHWQEPLTRSRVNHEVDSLRSLDVSHHSISK